MAAFANVALKHHKAVVQNHCQAGHILLENLDQTAIPATPRPTLIK